MQSRDWLALALIVGVITLVGAGAAGLGFWLGGGNPTVDGALIYPALWPADWVFWSVWLVIYPSSGVAAWLVWQTKAVTAKAALAAFALMNVASAFFLPIASFVASEPAVLTLMDLNGVVQVYVIAWLFRSVSPPAVVWLLPYLIWMPVTSLLKIWLWVLN